MESPIVLEIPRTTHILVLKMAAFGLHLLMFCLGLSCVWGSDNMLRDLPDYLNNRTKTLELGDEKIKVDVTMVFKCLHCVRPDRRHDDTFMQILGFTFCMVSSMLFAMGSILPLLCTHGLRYFFSKNCDRVILIICGILMLFNCFFLLHAPLHDCNSVANENADKVPECYRKWRYSEVVVSTLFGIASAFFYFTTAICICRLKTPDWKIMAGHGIPPEEASKYMIVPDSEAPVLKYQPAPGPSLRSLPQPPQTQTSENPPPLPAEP